MSIGELTIEAMEEDGWNAVALPIPINADKDLLIEIFGWCCDRIQIYTDIMREDGALRIPTTREKADAKERLIKARGRLKQVEWRLNVLGFYREDWGAIDNFTPVERNDRVGRIINNMAKPGNYECG